MRARQSRRSKPRSSRPRASWRATRPNSTGAERDMRRYTELVARTQPRMVNLDNAKTQVGRFTRRHRSQTRRNSKTSRFSSSYCTIRRRSRAASAWRRVKVGNFVRMADAHADRDHHSSRADLCHVHGAASEPPRLAQGACRPKLRPSRRSSPARARRHAASVTMIENTVDAPTGHGRRFGRLCRILTSCFGPARWSTCS